MTEKAKKPKDDSIKNETKIGVNNVKGMGEEKSGKHKARIDTAIQNVACFANTQSKIILTLVALLQFCKERTLWTNYYTIVLTNTSIKFAKLNYNIFTSSFEMKLCSEIVIREIN